MRWLEVHRHSLTKKGPARDRGSQLSAHGVALARAVGAELGPVAYVLTSTAPRAIETAVAMGVAVDDTVTCHLGTSRAKWASTSSGPGPSRGFATPNWSGGMVDSPP